MTLCTLADVKAMLDILDTSQDAKLNLLIKQASSAIVKHLGYPVARATYTGEKYAINNNQILILNAQPIQSITSITLAGVAVTDYDISPEYANIGFIYRGAGWCGNFYTRNLTNDPVAGFRDIVITWIGGWYLPGAVGYVEDNPASLPTDISTAATYAVIESYRVNMLSAEGIKSHSEGGISDTFGDNVGLSTRVRELLAPWVRVGIA
jgi:hypothetical protein